MRNKHKNILIHKSFMLYYNLSILKEKNLNALFLKSVTTDMF